MEYDQNTQVTEQDSAPHKRKGRIMLVAAVGFFIIVSGATGAYITMQKNKTQEPVQEQQPIVEQQQVETATTTSNTGFAPYTEVAVNVTPRVPAYSIPANLAGVDNPEDTAFSDVERALLAKNGFVVKPAYSREFFPLYENNRYNYIPSFVTTDSMLHNYHLMFNHLLKTLEEETLADELSKLNKGMMAEAVAHYEMVKATEWENAARRNVAFFTVGSVLLDPNTPIPGGVKPEVEEELALIKAHERIAESPIMNMGTVGGPALTSPQGVQPVEALKEDYSQYIPRGHYDTSEQLRNYFNSMMWYGRLTFRFKNEDEIKSALLITLALNKSDNEKKWNTIYEPINFFVGKSDDITYYQFRDVMKEVYGDIAAPQVIAKDETKFNQFVAATAKLAPPQINSIPIFNAAIQPDREKEIKGFRFLGQRFTVDASIFQRLIDREVPDRMLPKGLDIPAALGSEEALNILEDMGETKYDNYSTNMNKLRTHLSSLPKENWTQNLYWSWMHTLRPLLTQKEAGYPFFMMNDAWTRKELTTFLGSWTELKHDTILYTKQVYAELGGGAPGERDDRGYVEPNPHVYARLAGLLNMTKTGLGTRGLLSEDMKANLDKMEQLALSLKTISEKELSNTTLSAEDYELIRSYGGQLEHFWLEVNKKEMEKTGADTTNYLIENPAALVADVATDPNGQVLEEATGHIANIYVIVPIDGKLRITKGGIFTYYEFAQPIAQRLTDKQWREMLDGNEPPKLPTWTNAFIANE